MPATVEQVKVRLRKNDTVEVLTGRDAGKRGKVLQVIPQRNRVVVQGVAFIKRHTRPNPQKNIKGGVVEREASIHVSNVLLVCTECGKRTRIGARVMDDGRKVRVCRKCKGVLDR